MSAADRQAARVLGAPIVTEPDPLPPEPLASLAVAVARRADSIGCGFATLGDGMPGSAWLAKLVRDALARGDFGEVAALALFGMSLGLPKPPATLVPVVPARGALYLDRDGELVQVLPPSAWLPERWGPPAALPVVRILAPAQRSYNKPGEVAQRDLTGWTRVPPAAVAALRALAGAAHGERRCPDAYWSPAGLDD